jgi:hypothetical protein
MSEPRYRTEDFEDGEVVGAYGPNPDLRVWLEVEVGPPDSDRLLEIARQKGVDALDLARQFIREGLTRAAAVTITGPTDGDRRSEARTRADRS